VGALHCGGGAVTLRLFSSTMNDQIRILIESIRHGQYEDPAEKIASLAAALQEHAADRALLTSLLKAPQVPLRLAALEAGRRREELRAELLRLVDDDEARVRSKLAEVLAEMPAEIASDALKTLLGDSEEGVRVEALKAAGGKAEFAAIQRELLLNDPDWKVRHTAAGALGEQQSAEPAADLLTALAQDDDGDVRQRCAELLEKMLTQRREAAVKHLPTEIILLGEAECELKQLGGRFPKLLEWLRSYTSVAVNPQELARFGNDLTALAEAGTLPHAFKVEGPLRMLLDLMQRERVRSIALIGKSGVGKSSLVNELVHALARPESGRWRVLRVSPTDFMAGTKYLGEWETKLRELVEAVRRPRRVLLYVPNLADLAAMGRSSKSDANVASALAPYMEDGSVLLLGESTPEEFERGMGGELPLQRLFDKVLVEEASRDDTRAVLAGIRDEAKTEIAEDVLDALQEASDFFLSHLARPGSAATLLRSVIAFTKESGQPVTRRDVLNVLSQSTGIPAGLLDDGTPLDLPQLRSFFELRIMGQNEAVEAVVDVVTLIKAGLTDPNKPFSVMLFIGPTGVGKTELARGLAEFIFGDAARLLRFDMSEFAGQDGFTRLIGGRGENGLLTDAVRQRPFSVVLLDEIEKSHLNVFDLCLQIFDAGRLTDGRGRLVDFRRSIVILTSNIGAESPNTPLGFASQLAASAGDPDRTFRELSRFFRPEFLNRLDRIVYFQPLTMEVTERIARRELDLVLQRSGVARRGLTVNVDPSVVSLLVKEGYSPHFGARPLKRTVERLVLLPVARAIASGRAEPRSVLSMSADGKAVQVRLTVAARIIPAKAERPAPASPSSNLNLDPLKMRVAEMQPQLARFSDRKSELLARTMEAGFYQDKGVRDSTFDELHKLDQFLSRCERLREAIERLAARGDSKPPAENLGAMRERMFELESELKHVEFVAHSRDARDLSDAFVLLTLIKAEGESLDAVEKLARMYLGLAARRRFEASVAGELHDGKTDSAAIQVLGLGAFSLLTGEAGIHELKRRSRSRNSRTGREQTQEETAVLRVEVFAAGGEPDERFRKSTQTKVASLKPPRSRLIEKAAWQVSAFHEPSVRSLHLWFTGEKDAAVAGALRLLYAQAQAGGESNAAPVVIRRYDLGIGSRIKDLRTGRSTTRLAQFFRGQIEVLARL
jgi:ATP-dependent Clp protease ATP-binding subunit ClpC